MCSPHLMIQELDSTSLKAEYLHKLFGILHAQYISLLSPIRLFIQSFISEWTHRYLFYTLSYNPIHFSLLLKLFHLYPLGDLPLGSCVPLTYPHQHRVFFPAYTYFLEQQDAPVFHFHFILCISLFAFNVIDLCRSCQKITDDQKKLTNG